MYNTDMPTPAELPGTGQLVRSTLIALVTAVILLATVILPSEYAIDPTGVGRILGLTEMGEIKQQLADEAAADEATREALPQSITSEAPDTVSQAEDPIVAAPADSAPELDAPPADAWSDEVSLALAPGEGAEIKLTMQAGGTVTFEWQAEPGHLNSALHGDGTAGERVTYRNGRAEPGHADELIADFDGTHGWFWRNRSNETVTMTLQVRGDYSELRRVL